ncbi:hypothetical protein A2U01_0099590, partial [Trifolium medium]|nr:hypothetical protein [Trifolium medium]
TTSEEETLEVTTGGLSRKTVKGLGSCYERLVKEFLINIGENVQVEGSDESTSI